MQKLQTQIRQNDRVTSIGPTGSGKTTLAMSILEHFNCQRWIINPKAEPELKRRFEGQPDTRHIIPRPDDEEYLNDLFQQIFETGNGVVYIDEMMMIATANRWPQYLAYLYQQGRSRGLGVVACSQRPKRIPSFVIGQAEHVFCFRLKRAEDRVTVGKATGEDVEDVIIDLTPYSFLYAGDRIQEAKVCKPLQI